MLMLVILLMWLILFVVLLKIINVFIFLKNGSNLLNELLWFNLLVSNMIGFLNFFNVFWVVRIFVVFELL